MAELVIKVGSDAGSLRYQDGDVLLAYNDLRISCIHTQSLCFPRINGRRPVTEAGIRVDPDGLAFTWMSQTRKYRFDRISRTEVRRTRLSDGDEEIFNDTPNQNGERMDVPLFVSRMTQLAIRNNSGGKPVFGTPGNEVWFGGPTTYTPAVSTAIWDEIEARLSVSRLDYRRVPNLNYRKDLVLLVDDFTDTESAQLVEPLLNRNEDIVAKRRRFVNFSAVVSPDVVSRIRDTKEDVRLDVQFTRALVVSDKAS